MKLWQYFPCAAKTITRIFEAIKCLVRSHYLAPIYPVKEWQTRFNTNIKAQQNADQHAESHDSFQAIKIDLDSMLRCNKS